MLSDGIFITAIPPARLEFGSTAGGDLPGHRRTVRRREHARRRHARRRSAPREVEHQHVSRHHEHHVQCTSLTGCRLLGTANLALPERGRRDRRRDDRRTTRPAPSPSPGRALVGHGHGACSEHAVPDGRLLRRHGARGDPRAPTPTTSRPQPDAYARPKGATPLRVSLVPAYQACAVPNREHGPPLVNPSCNPPAAVLAERDGRNARRERSAGELGRVRALLRAGRARPRHPGRSRRAHLGRCDGHPRRAARLADYTGELQAQVTSADHRPQQLAAAADLPGRPDRDGAGHAALRDRAVHRRRADRRSARTAAVVDSRRRPRAGDGHGGRSRGVAVRPVRLLDGGLDGDAETAADNMLFATQGVFVP